MHYRPLTTRYDQLIKPSPFSISAFSHFFHFRILIYQLRDHFRVVFMLQHLYFFRQGFGCICFIYRAGKLENVFAVIKLLIHIMYGNAAFFLTGFNYSFMNKMTVHTISAIFG